MDQPIQQMSLNEFAELHRRFGTKVVCRNNRFWRQVRPFFYRPLLPVEGYDESEVQPPVTWPSGYQYVVANGHRANSTMNFIMLDDLRSYSIASLSHNRRRLIKQAARRFQVRSISDLQELKEHGYKAYLSFYQRTGYAYKSDRKNRAIFNTWAETLFRHPKAFLLGGYGSDGLVAVLCSFWINQTLVCATLFCETKAMQRNVGEVLFHEVRQAAAQQPQINEIYVRGYRGGNSLDQYYLHRGCKLVRKPARLQMSSSIQTLIRWVMPHKYALLSGDD